MLLTREHCRPDQLWAQREDGNSWDTVKPLALHGLPLERCIIVEDSERKLLQEERANALVLPAWEGSCEPNNDEIVNGVLPMLSVLCALLNDTLGSVSEDVDVRNVLPTLRMQLEEVCFYHMFSELLGFYAADGWAAVKCHDSTVL